MPTFDDLNAALTDLGQGHLLAGWARLDGAGRDRLVASIGALDLAAVPALAARARSPVPHASLAPEDLAPPETVVAAEAVDAHTRARGEAALRAGRVAAFVVAGGDGTRLGFDGPKGAFPAGAVTGKSLFALLAEGVLATGRRYGVEVPWWVMTSPENHRATVDFFEAHRCFGLRPEAVHFCIQGTLPTFDTAGRLLLAAPDKVLVNPDGHGGSLRVLARSGALAEMAARGVDLISYFQVDNPLARVVNPDFLGLHLDPTRSSGQMSGKVVEKAAPEERVGVYARVGGATRVVEYSDLPPSLAAARTADGRLRYAAGNVAQHVLGRDFVAGLSAGGDFALPLHRARKTVSAFDPAVGAVRAVAAVKLESFVFDAMPRCDRPALLAVARAEGFAPIKNADGADSPATCAAAQTARAAAWLRAAGVEVPVDADGDPDCVLEISALTALEAGDLAAVPDLPPRITPGARWYR